MRALLLSQNQLEEMTAHVEALAPREACGLLAGKDGRVETVLPIANQAQSETRYVMAPLEQLRAFEWMDENGLELLGIYHSHPKGPPTPSPTDVAQAYYPTAYVILSRVGTRWRARAFWMKDGSFHEIGLRIA